MSLSVNVEYNPYYLRTKIEIYGKDIKENSDYKKINDKIAANIPLQSWIDKSYSDSEWKGLLEELAELTGEINFDFTFTGRKIDFIDFKKSIEEQNKERKYTTEFKENITLYDDKLSEYIEETVTAMLKDDFKAIVDNDMLAGDFLKKKYTSMKDDYDSYKNVEFKIVFSGLVSSGKSTVINALIGRWILPSKGDTCTSRILRIKHKKDANESIFLLCRDKENQIVVEQEEYTNDIDVKNRLQEICPDDKTFKSNPETVETIELEMDLGHLYPNKSLQEQFTVVIVDTPGTDSGRGNNISEGTRHDIITLNTILDSKEMVIFNVDGTTPEKDSVLDFLDKIESKSSENIGFNDRFLFLMNKCDSKQYNVDESLEKAIKNYSDYLCISENGKKRKQLSPRIFPVCAGPALAEKKNLLDPNKYGKGIEKTFATMYSEFKNRCMDPDESFAYDFRLNLYAGLPEYQREELNKEYEGKGEIDQVLLHTGIPSLEYAIKQYIERYAYPLKAKDLMNTFSGILRDLRATIVRELDIISKKRTTKTEEAEKNAKEEEQEQRKFEDVKKDLYGFKERVNGISNKDAEYTQIRAQYEEDFQNILTKLDQEKYNNRAKTEELVKEVQDNMNRLIGDLKEKATTIAKEACKQQNDIIKDLKKQTKKIEDSLPFKERNWFNESAIKDELNKIENVYDLEKNIHQHTELKYDMSGEWLLKRAFWFIFHPFKSKQTKTVYSIEDVKNSIEEINTKIRELIEQLRGKNGENIKEMNGYITSYINRVIGEIENHKKNAKKFRKSIENSDLNDIENKLNDRYEVIDEPYRNVRAYIETAREKRDNV